MPEDTFGRRFRKEGMAAEIQGAEPLTSPPEVTGGRAQEEQQPGPALQQNAPAGSSKGAGSADRKVPAGPPLAPSTHVVQDGAAEVAAGTSAGKSGPRKAKGTRKKGAKVTAAGTPGAKRPRGKHGPARPTGESVPTEGEGPREDGGRERPLPGPTPPLQPIPGPGYGHWGGPGTPGPWGPPPIMRQFVEAPPQPQPSHPQQPAQIPQPRQQAPQWLAQTAFPAQPPQIAQALAAGAQPTLLSQPPQIAQPAQALPAGNQSTLLSQSPDAQAPQATQPALLPQAPHVAAAAAPNCLFPSGFPAGAPWPWQFLGGAWQPGPWAPAPDAFNMQGTSRDRGRTAKRGSKRRARHPSTSPSSSGSGSPPKRRRRTGEHSTLGSDSEAEGESNKATTGKGSRGIGLEPILTRPTPFRPSSPEREETSSTITSVTDNGKEEGEWSGEETEQKPVSSRLFQAEHFQRLLTKVISTLNYQMETPEVPRSSASAHLDPRGFKKPVKIQTFSPFPDYFEDVIREEWANPGGGTSLLSLARRFYSLPDNIMEDLKVPLIDAPVVALHSGAVMPKDGENALKDAFDRKNENALKKAHEAMSLAVRSAATLSNFTRATAIWADNLLQNPEVSPLVLRRTLLKMKRAAEFAADASQDNIQFCARAQAANIIIRRNIWLKHWKGEGHKS
ncbi:UNVERIFIED_CONTAM: hypothetical protein K2H54_058674 [Gekko kuhli]